MVMVNVGVSEVIRGKMGVTCRMPTERSCSMGMSCSSQIMHKERSRGTAMVENKKLRNGTSRYFRDRWEREASWIDSSSGWTIEASPGSAQLVQLRGPTPAAELFQEAETPQAPLLYPLKILLV